MTTTTTTTRTGTFQMLWDCPSCGTRKLLGVDHRHCPHCGAPQEENLRYFPSKADRVATSFRGTDPDWECSHCGTPTGSTANHCGGCGAPRGDSEFVFVRPSIPADQSETGEQATADWREREGQRWAEQYAEQRNEQRDADVPMFRNWRWQRVVGRMRSLGDRTLQWFRGIRRRPWRLAWLGLGATLLIVLLLAVCDRQVQIQMVMHSWTRVVPVERYSTFSESAWCSSTPGGARIHSRVSEVHHYDKIPDGEDCRTVPGSCSQSCSNIDHGNGSFSEVCSETCSSDRTECTTRYREEPVYADKCYYEIDRWAVIRKAETQADDLSPYWPADPAFSGCSHVSVGCERIGQRYGIYAAHYVNTDADERDDDGKRERFVCEWPEAKWRALPIGAQFVGEVSRLTGRLDCDALESVERPG